MMDYLAVIKAKEAIIDGSRKAQAERRPVMINPVVIDREQDKELERLYQASEAEFADSWIIGVWEALDAKDRPLAAQIDRARDNLDTTWVKVRAGEATKEDFIKSLKEWKEAHIRGLARVGVVGGEQLALKMVNP